MVQLLWYLIKALNLIKNSPFHNTILRDISGDIEIEIFQKLKFLAKICYFVTKSYKSINIKP